MSLNSRSKEPFDNSTIAASDRILAIATSKSIVLSTIDWVPRTPQKAPNFVISVRAIESESRSLDMFFGYLGRPGPLQNFSTALEYGSLF